MGQMKYNHCGKSGHKSADCWQREENESKQPQNYRPPVEQAQANVNKNKTGNSVEYLMAGITFPTYQTVLSDPNVWIANTAATVHTTHYSQGMKKNKEATTEDAITAGNGNREPALQIASINGTICNKHRNKLNQTKLTEVTHLPSEKFNLFSLTRLQQQGWLLGGNKTAIWLTNKDQKVTFDMMISTNKGLLFAMYFK
jgi:hypothetical protein